MKHLIALSFKYIRRQKLRSVLTFLCIMLAVFIFNTFTAYLGSTIATLINFEKYYGYGAYHVKLDRVLPYCEDLGKTGQLLQNHAVVDDHYVYIAEELWGLSTRDAEGTLRYLDVQFDNGTSQRVCHFRNEEISGDPQVMYSGESLEQAYNDKPIPTEENSVYFPDWVQQLGYAAGDTVTMTVTPMKAKLSEDSEQMKAVRAWMAERNAQGDSIYAYDDPNAENLGYGSPLMSYLLELYDVNEIEFSEKTAGSPCTFTVMIAGFTDESEWYSSEYTSYMVLWSHPVNDIRTDELVTGENADFLTGSENTLRRWPSAAVRISENIDFDEGVMMLLKDMGLEEKHRYELIFNDNLLAYEMRSADAISAIMPLIVSILLLALVAWLICRFVIDNAFEISVQERSAQFATLRIMGASRAQLVALILTEALFYCLTAVPIGVITAFGACKMVMELLGGTLFPIFAFDVNITATILGILLSLAGILISAYTSAMWAARKLSPMEALQYGKPRRRPRKEKHRKSILEHKSFGFVLDYTIKNISRTRSRYVISTVAMALGIVMFTFCVLGVNLVNSLSHQLRETGDIYDYELQSFGYTPESVQEAESLFRENDAIRFYSQNTSGIVLSQDIEADFEKVAKMQPYEYQFTDYHILRIIDRNTYEELLAPVSGISYEKFTAGGGMVYVSSTGSAKEETFSKETRMMERRVEDGYWTWEEKGFAEQPVITLDTGQEIPLMGAVCVDDNLLHANRGSILIAADAPLDQNLLPNLYTTIHLTVNGHQHYKEAKALIDEFTGGETIYYVLDNYMENTGLISFANTIFRTLSIFLISVWLVGILTMVNSINTSVLNRQKELLMLRSVGMTKKQLQRSVMLEGVLYCALSTVLGILIGTVGYCVLLEYISWQEAGLNTMQTYIMPIFLTAAGTILLNLLIAVLAAVPALDSLSKRMK